MKDFIHLVTTRFNVPTSDWVVTRDGQKSLSEEWLQDRFELFQKYCLPSFINQSVQNFFWLVFFDEKTPESYLEQIKTIQLRYPRFQPIFVRDFDEMYTKTIESISGLRNSTTQYIISTDIDNDDLLHQDFIKTIQQLYQPEHNLVIDLKRGLQLTKISDALAKVNVFYMVANPFVSLVEEIENCKTVIKQSHTLYRDQSAYVSYDAKPRFIQFIHNYNLVNDTWSTAKRVTYLNFADYGLKKENHFQVSIFDALVANTRINFNLIKKILKKA